MLKNILVIALTLSTASFIATASHAEEVSAPSYMAKKQGRVPFTSNTEDTAAAQEEPSAETVQTIEPAAGAEEEAEDTSSTALESNMRLPRKN